MASKRQRGNSWEFTVRRKGLLPAPVSLSFTSEAEGDAVVARIEAELAAGRVPRELIQRAERATSVAQLIDRYREASALPDSEQPLLDALAREHGVLRLDALDYPWAETWVGAMKRGRGLAPVTIRHYVGAMARCIDWALRRRLVAENPLRELPRRYSVYNDADARALAASGREPIGSGVRDRRVLPEDEQAIGEILAGDTPTGRQRALALPHAQELQLLFDLALETAMRMREMFTLLPEQVVLDRRTIFLDRTKNGDTRQVPLSSRAGEILERYLDEHPTRRGQPMLPWWNGERTTRELNKVSARLSKQYGRIFDAAERVDLHFHDTRHEATCRLFQRTTLDPVRIARITGHKDPRMLLRYLSLRGSDLAEHLW